MGFRGILDINHQGLGNWVKGAGELYSITRVTAVFQGVCHGVLGVTVGPNREKTMTAQIPDTFLFKGDGYDLIGISGGDLASPEQFGMEPEMLHTACQRGFYATYELTGAGLYLRELTLREKNEQYLPIGKVQPELAGGKATYRDLSELVSFTGQIRLAKDFIDELYIHMGYQKPTAFKTVLDIILDNGQVVEIKDRSQEMEKKRGRFKEHYESGSIVQGIDDAFSLAMELE